jgi:hypothetical protein
MTAGGRLELYGDKSFLAGREIKRAAAHSHAEGRGKCADRSREHLDASIPDHKTRRCGRDADSDQAKFDAGRERERTGHPVPEERYDERRAT